VITHSDSEAARDPPQQKRNPKRFPGKVKERNYRSDMKGHHKSSRQPIDLIAIFREVFRDVQDSLSTPETAKAAIAGPFNLD